MREVFHGSGADASLGVASDWDLARRLTADRDALTLPALAALYTTSTGTADRSDYRTALARVKEHLRERERSAVSRALDDDPG